MWRLRNTLVLVYSYQRFISDDIEHIESFENHYKFKDRRRKLRLVLDCRFFSTDFIPEKNQIMEDEVGSVMNSLSEKTVNKKFGFGKPGIFLKFLEFLTCQDLDIFLHISTYLGIRGIFRLVLTFSDVF